MRAVTREQIEAGPQNIWRYAALLPVGQDPADAGQPRPRHDPAGPRRPAGRGARPDRRAVGQGRLGQPDPLLQGPRGVSLAATAAKGLGYAKIAAASTGNLANSVAAHAARAGIASFVFIPSDLEPGKVVQSAVYGQTLVAVDGSYDDVNRLTSELAETDEFEDTAFVNQNVRPYYAEGSKTMGYEIAEQLGWRIPAQVVIPMASGSLLTKVDKAFRELAAAGIVEPTPGGRSSAPSRPAATRSPRRSTTAGTSSSRSSRPASRSRSNIGNPADGPYALDAIRRTGGAVGRVGDDEIVAGHPRPGPHHRRLRRDRRRGDRRGAAPAGRGRPAGPGARRPSSSTPARGSRPSTRCCRSSGPPTASSPRCGRSRAAGLIG